MRCQTRIGTCFDGHRSIFDVLGGALRKPLYVCWGAVEKIRPKRVPNRVTPHFVKNTILTVSHASMTQSKTRIRVYGSQRRIIASNVLFLRYIRERAVTFE